MAHRNQHREAAGTAETRGLMAPSEHTVQVVESLGRSNKEEQRSPKPLRDKCPRAVDVRHV
jgi:hypothetical protein